MNTLIRIMIGGAIGIWFSVAVVFLLHNHPEPEYVIAPAILDGRVQFGEIVVCGEMITSGIHGPDLRAYEGPIQFYHDHEEDQ